MRELCFGAQYPPRIEIGIVTNLSRIFTFSPSSEKGRSTRKSRIVNPMPPSREVRARASALLKSTAAKPAAKLERYIAISDNGKSRECTLPASKQMPPSSRISAKKQISPHRDAYREEMISFSVGGLSVRCLEFRFFIFYLAIKFCLYKYICVNMRICGNTEKRGKV